MYFVPGRYQNSNNADENSVICNLTGEFSAVYTALAISEPSQLVDGGENLRMNFVQFITEAVFKPVNFILDAAFLAVVLVLFVSYPIYFFIANLKKYVNEKKSAALLTETVILFVVVSFAGAIWALPEVWWFVSSWVMRIPFTLPARWAGLAWAFSSVRLLVASGFFFTVAWFFGHEYGEARWRKSALLHIGVIAIGWLFYRWVGLVFISLPLLWSYHASLRDLALVIVPASDPEDKAEQKKRRNAFMSYTWGTQSPMYVVDEHSWKEYKPRIPGDIAWAFSDFPIPVIKNLDWRPGLIWTRSHQAVGITGGTKFKRIDGPGVAFTGRLERLDQVFDLRLQLRTKEIEVVSKDGIHFLARYFTAFRIDNEDWSQETYDALRPRNYLLRGANNLNRKVGSFPFSTARVQATLGTTSTKATTGEPVYWDQWVMNIVEDQTRQVLSQKNLDEMWRPANDEKFANALNLIAAEIKGRCDLTVRSAGILLVVARVVNFRFIPREGAKENEMDEISAQQIATWKSEWDRKRDAIISDAEAEAERAQQEARAYAEAVLLNAIAEGIEKTSEINPYLPHYVIAMRFLSALQDYIHEQPEGDKRNKLANEFKTWQDTFYPGEDDEN